MSTHCAQTWIQQKERAAGEVGVSRREMKSSRSVLVAHVDALGFVELTHTAFGGRWKLGRFPSKRKYEAKEENPPSTKVNVVL